MGRLILAGILAALAPAVVYSEESCVPAALEKPLLAEVTRLGGGGTAVEILRSPARLAAAWRAVARKYPDAQPDHFSCVLAGLAEKALTDSETLEGIVEAYRREADAAFSSMVLIGVFRKVSDPGVLARLFDHYQARACTSPEASAFDQRVAGDILTCSSESFRIEFVEGILELYGPGSGVHYKIEATDCRFLVDRALAQDAAATFPEEKRRRFQDRLSALYR